MKTKNLTVPILIGYILCFSAFADSQNLPLDYKILCQANTDASDKGINASSPLTNFSIPLTDVGIKYPSDWLVQSNNEFTVIFSPDQASVILINKTYDLQKGESITKNPEKYFNAAMKELIAKSNNGLSAKDIVFTGKLERSKDGKVIVQFFTFNIINTDLTIQMSACFFYSNNKIMLLSTSCKDTVAQEKYSTVLKEIMESLYKIENN